MRFSSKALLVLAYAGVSVAVAAGSGSGSDSDVVPVEGEKQQRGWLRGLTSRMLPKGGGGGGGKKSESSNTNTKTNTTTRSLLQEESEATVRTLFGDVVDGGQTTAQEAVAVETQSQTQSQPQTTSTSPQAQGSPAKTETETDTTSTATTELVATPTNETETETELVYSTRAQNATNATKVQPLSEESEATKGDQGLALGFRGGNGRQLSENSKAIDLPLHWTMQDTTIEGGETFMTNPSFLFHPTPDGGLELVRAARLFTFYSTNVVDDHGTILEQIYHYRSSMLVQSEPFMGNLDAAFEDSQEWGILGTENGLKPMVAVDDTLLSTHGEVWSAQPLCEPKPKILGTKLIRKIVQGPEDPKITPFPNGNWGISYSSYPLPSQVTNEEEEFAAEASSSSSSSSSCKWSPEAVFQMYLVNDGPGLAQGKTATGQHLQYDTRANTQNDKNWIPFVHQDQMHYIQSIQPLRVIKCDNVATCEAVPQSQLLPTTSKLLLALQQAHHEVRGNAIAVKYDCHTNTYLALLHTLDDHPGGGYTTRAFKFTAQDGLFQVTAVSKPLPLFHGQQAFASSLVIQSDKIFVGYGVADQLSRVLVMNKEYLEEFFNIAQEQDEPQDQTSAVVVDPFTITMEERRLNKSYAHQIKFLRRKDQLLHSFSNQQRFFVETGEFTLVALPDSDFSYLHIWKSGGTSVQLQPGASSQITLTHPQAEALDFFTFVRDPLDHFLSGWAEASLRFFQEADQETLPAAWEPATYNQAIRSYLDNVHREVEIRAGTNNHDGIDMTHYIHSFPQANFLLRKDGSIMAQVKVIGDMEEMYQVMDMIGFAKEDSKSQKIHARNAAEDKVKSTFFPIRKEWISDDTLLEICKFVAMDYFLFDFEAPEVCARAGGPLDF